jgi:hypothetical protein
LIRSIVVLEISTVMTMPRMIEIDDNDMNVLPVGIDDESKCDEQCN